MAEFIVVVDDSVIGFRYRLHIVPDGGGVDARPRDYIGGSDRLRGIGKIIRQERARRARGGARIVHREMV